MSVNEQLKKLLLRMASEKTGDFDRRAALDTEERAHEAKLRKADREAQVAERLYGDNEYTPESERITVATSRDRIQKDAQKFVDSLATDPKDSKRRIVSIATSYSVSKRSKKLQSEMQGLKTQLAEYASKTLPPEEAEPFVQAIGMIGDGSSPTQIADIFQRKRLAVAATPARPRGPRALDPQHQLAMAAAATPAKAPDLSEELRSLQSMSSGPAKRTRGKKRAAKTPESVADLPGELRSLQSMSSGPAKRTRGKTRVRKLDMDAFLE